VRVSSEDRFVFDRRSMHNAVSVPGKRFLLFGKASQMLKFSPGGALISYSSANTSSAGALGSALGAAPGQIAASLESTKKLLDQYDAIHDRPDQRHLEQLKQDIAIKTKELEQQGLAANTDLVLELDRLKREADVLAQRKLVGGYGPKPGDPVAAATSAAELNEKLLVGEMAKQLLASMGSMTPTEKLQAYALLSGKPKAGAG